MMHAAEIQFRNGLIEGERRQKAKCEVELNGLARMYKMEVERNEKLLEEIDQLRLRRDKFYAIAREAQAESDKFKADAVHARTVAMQIEGECDALRALVQRAAPLLKEVVLSHADPDDPSYNECEKPNSLCAWCEDAQPIIDAALREGKE